MPRHIHQDTGGWLCEATGQVATEVWSDHDRWAREGHPYNECRHCNPEHKTIAEALYDLNEKARREHEKARRRRKR